MLFSFKWFSEWEAIIFFKIFTERTNNRNRTVSDLPFPLPCLENKDCFIFQTVTEDENIHSGGYGFFIIQNKQILFH